MSNNVGIGAGGLKCCLRLAAAVAAAVAGLAMSAPVAAHWGTPGLTELEVFDRQEGTSLPVYEKDGRRYVVGTPGHEYTLRVRNLTSERVLAVTSVDGVNVVTGETASPDQSGYVLDPFGSVEIGGWRKSLSHIAAFYFTDLGDSYAARTGRPGNVGVIGVAVFRERPRPIAYQRPREKIARDDAAAAEAQAPARGTANAASPPASDGSASGVAEPLQAPTVSASASAQAAARDSDRMQPSERKTQTFASPLGTGHGRNEASYVTQVAFERASASPSQTVSIQYDRRETLAAMGVLPRPYYARRSPDAFPGSMRFAPDPR